MLSKAVIFHMAWVPVPFIAGEIGALRGEVSSSENSAVEFKKPGAWNSAVPRWDMPFLEGDVEEWCVHAYFSCQWSLVLCCCNMGCLSMKLNILYLLDWEFWSPDLKNVTVISSGQTTLVRGFIRIAKSPCHCAECLCVSFDLYESISC